MPEAPLGAEGAALSEVRLAEHGACCTTHIQGSSSEELFKWGENYCGTGRTTGGVFKNWKVTGDRTVPASGVKPGAAIGRGGCQNRHPPGPGSR